MPEGTRSLALRIHFRAAARTLTAEECAILDEQRERFAPFNTSGISEHSHQQLGWLFTEDGEPIPLVTSQATSPRLSANELREAQRTANDIAKRRKSV